MPGLDPVAVIGAGPAGCAAAWVLAQVGIPVCLIERGHPGKDKPCGDAFVADAVAALAAYGVTSALLTELGGVPYHQVMLTGALAAAPPAQSGEEPLGWVVPRAVMDQWLRDRVSQKVPTRYETTVTRILPQPGAAGFLLEGHSPAGPLQFPAAAVIIATGAANHLSRAWGIDGDPIMGASLSQYADAPPPEGLVFEFAPHFQPGYAWTFPLANGAINRGVCALGRGGLALHTRAQRIGEPKSDHPWRGGGHALWSGRGTRWHHARGIVSCGDAAGLTSPISAEGITAALVSGRQAGIALAEYLAKDRSLDALAAYSAWVSAYGKERYQTQSGAQLIWELWTGLAARE
jgi:flavin-dependent dehydrogenase